LGDDLRRQHVQLDVGALGPSSGPHRCWAIKMPLACSITGKDSSLVCIRAKAESRRTSRCGRPVSIHSMIACRRAVASPSRLAWARFSARAASKASCKISCRDRPLASAREGACCGVLACPGF
jgi:hypothetical protein